MKRAFGLISGFLIIAAVGALVLVDVLQGPAANMDLQTRDQLLQRAATAAPLADLLWYGVATLIVLSAAVTTFAPNILHAGLGLLGAFLGVAILFVFLSADFLAVAQVAVYIGGILVLILFAVMLTNRVGDGIVTNPTIGLPVAAGLGGAVFLMLGFVGFETNWPLTDPGELQPTIDAIGHAFLEHYLLPFEIASVLLLAVMIGAVLIVRKEVRPE